MELAASLRILQFTLRFACYFGESTSTCERLIERLDIRAFATGILRGELERGGPLNTVCVALEGKPRRRPAASVLVNRSHLEAGAKEGVSKPESRS